VAVSDEPVAAAHALTRRKRQEELVRCGDDVGLHL